MRIARVVAVVAVGVGLGLVTASAAAKQRVTIGSDLPRPGEYGFSCSNGGPGGSCTWVQSSLGPDNPYRLKAPFDGVITRFRYRKAEDESGYPIRLSVGRKVEAQPGGLHPDWRFTGQSRRVMAGAKAGVYAYRAHVPIKKGQSIGMVVHGTHASNWTWNEGHGFFFDPAPSVGEVTEPSAWFSEAERLWNATLRRR